MIQEVNQFQTNDASTSIATHKYRRLLFVCGRHGIYFPLAVFLAVKSGPGEMGGARNGSSGFIGIGHNHQFVQDGVRHGSIVGDAYDRGCYIIPGEELYGAEVPVEAGEVGCGIGKRNDTPGYGHEIIRKQLYKIRSILLYMKSPLCGFQSQDFISGLFKIRSRRVTG